VRSAIPEHNPDCRTENETAYNADPPREAELHSRYPDRVGAEPKESGMPERRQPGISHQDVETHSENGVDDHQYQQVDIEVRYAACWREQCQN
jgi:hypothetical protein